MSSSVQRALDLLQQPDAPVWTALLLDEGLLALINTHAKSWASFGKNNKINVKKYKDKAQKSVKFEE